MKYKERGVQNMLLLLLDYCLLLRQNSVAVDMDSGQRAEYVASVQERLRGKHHSKH